MSNEIRSFYLGEARQGKMVSTGPADKAGAGTTGGSPAKPAGEKVTLTDVARKLSALSAQASGGPVIDQAKVARLRAEIESGQYQANPEAIAEALLRFDQGR